MTRSIAIAVAAAVAGLGAVEAVDGSGDRERAAAADRGDGTAKRAVALAEAPDGAASKVPGFADAPEAAASGAPGFADAPRGEHGGPQGAARAPAGTRPAGPRPGVDHAAQQGVPAPSAGRAPSPGDAHLIVKVRAGESVRVRDRPGGRVVGRVQDRTDFGSRTALAVLATRGGGRWLGVSTIERPNGRIGWIRADSKRLAYARTDRSLHVDLSERSMELRDGARVLRSATVGIGRPGSPTPTGRFGVSDRMLGSDFGFWYGCCIVAFTAIQPHLPPGWQGGNRIAVHGTNAPDTIGRATSAGCLRAAGQVLRGLMLELSLGAPVVIRR